MAKVDSLLSKRLEKNAHKLEKMRSVAERGVSGNLSSFSGVFKVAPLSESEKTHINKILLHYQKEESESQSDLEILSCLTSELKAINNQAIILHGERIKQAQTVLKKYKNGAFTAWLLLTYGNRQTPYNFLQYYELFVALSSELKSKLEEMPKQAVYTLASRVGDVSEKEGVIRNFQGQSKKVLLDEIRKLFPLSKSDKRKAYLSYNVIFELKSLLNRLRIADFSPTQKERNELNTLLSQLIGLVNNGDEEDLCSL